MARRVRDGAAARLLEFWEPPAGAGEPLGCVATTFTFDPAFFEEHCLSRFLRLETDPREDGAAYLIEREEKLAITRVSVLVDRSQAGGSPSARWDVLAVRVPGAICHAKISVLAWSGWVRVVIGSANLTEPAYRKNQEVAGVLDFHDGGEVPVEVLQGVLSFLESLSRLAPGEEDRLGPKVRLVALLRRLAEGSRGWKANPPKPRESPQVVPVLLGPMEPYRLPVLDRLGRVMRERAGPANQALVLSPFFDQTPEPAYAATTALLAALTDRGRREVGFLVPADPLPDGRLRLRAPRSLLTSARKTAEYAVYPVREDFEREQRPLHAKSIWLWNDRWHVYAIGSSNFTAAGLGLEGHSPNVEANLAYVFPAEPPLVRQFEQSLPQYGDALNEPESALWEPIDKEKMEDAPVSVALPAGFEEALFDPREGGGVLLLRFGKTLPAQWEIHIPEESTLLYSADRWVATRRPSDVEITWQGSRVPNALAVQWESEARQRLSATWPVNVTDPSRLLPPDELRDLPLETLVEVLGSGRPLHEAVLQAKQKAAGKMERRKGDEPAPELDPLRRVSSETFLLQRTRRVAKAIEHLVEHLNRPVLHADALHWRLRGPVGPLALARALGKAARSPGEACFLLSEVVRALGRVEVPRISVGVDEAEVRREVLAVRTEVESMARELLQSGGVPAGMAEYVVTALGAST